MRRSNSAMIRSCGASLSSSHGGATALSSVPLPMKRGVLACAQPCRQLGLNGSALAPSSSLRISHATALSHLRRAKSSSVTGPLSLDEAYLDVTENKTGLPTATRVARTIREQIREELNLTASAGVAPNKFLAKLASDWRKPDGLFVIKPEDVDEFLLRLPVARLPGVGKVTEEKLKSFEILTLADLRKFDSPTLESRFGRYGVRLWELARGIDDSPVIPDRPTQSVSAEDTFEHDVPLTETETMIRRLAEKAWTASRKELRIPRTVVLKLKTSEFKILTRSYTPPSPPSSCAELTSIALSLRDRVGLAPEQRFRLVGVGLSNFRDPDPASAQPTLFD